MGSRSKIAHVNLTNLANPYQPVIGSFLHITQIYEAVPAAFEFGERRNRVDSVNVIFSPETFFFGARVRHKSSSSARGNYNGANSEGQKTGEH